MVAIEIKNLSKQYLIEAEERKWLDSALPFLRKSHHEELWALRNISCKIDKGTMFGIIGRNGSGKSTLLRIIAGITEPSGGKVIANGRISALLELGVGFHPELSGYENIFLYGSALGVPAQVLKDRVDEIVKFSELEEFIDIPVKNYSSGMFARLGFAVAINVDPDIILIDEILSVGDAYFQAKSFEKIQEFRKRGKTIIFVAHNINMAENVCDEIMMLEKGEAQALGDPQTVALQYRKFIVSQLRNSGLNRNGKAHSNGKMNWFSQLNFSAASSKVEGDEIAILGIEIKDSNGIAKNTFDTFDTMIIDVEIDADRNCPDRTAFLIISKVDGAVVSVLESPNVRKVNDQNTPSAGREKIRYSLEPLTLLKGEYFISVAIARYSPPHGILSASLKEHTITIKSDFFTLDGFVADIPMKWKIE